ncbi:alkene reductase [Enterovirga rhinocerotis]|uniref:2,4-dienoyl-CoA reductase-like NADH-dependent reductase (Old Yellow Enzyme family) n=1 Tax=Enterovirga rhinocerotis TaxID=1339210 RepID=A0A4R7BYU8_9HYPH|nr:alkene reductase [Enterovirga rhinocerotis]TDR89226.1 2,4-dienoyl-CoA reductase-like NADH-dependent reductase (Old Yellow Enzyme family) [Enterovirga rhinocerotis]
MTSLFDPIRLGAVTARNRIVMAPLTRARATRDHVPVPMMIDYYRQRAGAGLIITEATGISPQALGWPYAPGIWNDEQVEAWKPITRAVHEAGGLIVCQLWHMGRVVHPSLPGRSQPLSSSATTMPGLARTYDGKQPYSVARPMTIDDIHLVLGEYRAATRNAQNAGFDGVQIHAANGYLIDQFLRDNANFRTDEYGGSIENRIRFLRNVVRAVADTIGPDRTGVRLSPNEERQGVNDSNPEPLFEEAARMLSHIGIAYLEVREPDYDGTNGKAERPPVAPRMRAAFRGSFILNSDYTQAKGQAALDAGLADAISFGRPFIANPDLPRRFSDGIPLASDDADTWYAGGEKGYIDYPAAP